MERFATLLLSLILLGTSCSDFLNLIPKNQQVVASMDDVKLELYSFLSMFTVKDGFYSTITYGGSEVKYPLRNDICTHFCMYEDDLVMSEFMASSDGERYKGVYYENVNWKGYDLSYRLWNDLYVNIGFLNTIENDAKKHRDGREADYEKITGEVRVTRAFYLLKLLQFFAPYHDNEMGIPVNLDQENIVASARWTQKDVYHLIIEELSDVLKYKEPKEKWNIFYDENVINAILAQLYMFKAESGAAESTDWENAEKYSSKIIAKYEIENTQDAYLDIFIPQTVSVVKNHPNVVLKFVNKGTSSISGLSNGPWGDGNRQIASSELYNLYDTNDIRLGAFFNPLEKEGGFRNYVCKYRYGYKNGNLTDIVILFRASEMFLINAEAHIKMNDFEGAKILLEKFKKAKIPNYTQFEGSDVLSEIYKERRKELCYECDLRWLDMKRLGVSVSRMGQASDKDELVDYTLKADDYRYALPIPQDVELLYNNIKQNPGWGNVK